MSTTTSVRPSKGAPATRGEKAKPAPETPKNIDNSVKIQPTAEQIRIAQIINDTKDTDDPDLQMKIKQVMELTGKSSDEASVALHDCDNDTNRAVNMLLEGEADQGEWETSSKRKKNRQLTPVTNAENNANTTANNKENRNRSERGRDTRGEREGGGSSGGGGVGGGGMRNRAPPRMSRGRGRDSEKNERNLENNREGSSERRGRGFRFMNGGGGGRPSRGGRGGGMGGPANRLRTFHQNRDGRGGGSSGGDGGGGRGTSGSHSDFPRSIETWSNVTAEAGESGEREMHVGNWSDKDSFPTAEDWDNEDWAGSLAETKVFTPSVSTSATVNSTVAGSPQANNMDVASLGLQQELQSGSVSGSGVSSSSAVQYSADITNDILGTSSIGSPSITQTYSAPVTNVTVLESSSLIQTGTYSISPMANSSLEAALGSSLVGGGLSSVGSQQPTTIPSRPKPHRVRSLASSKIPSSAVEMPDDTIAALDVQFGSLEFGSESSSLGFNSVLDNTGSIPTAISSTPSIANHVNSLSSNQGSLSNSVLHVSSTTIGKSSVDMVGDQGSLGSYQTSSSALAASGNTSVKELVQPVNAALSPIMSELMKSQLLYINPVEHKTAPPFVTQRTPQSAVLESSLSVGKIVDSSSLSAYNVAGTNLGNHGSYEAAYGAHKPSSYSHHHSTSLPNSAPQSQTSLYSSPSYSSVPPVASSAYSVPQTTYTTSVATVPTYVSGSSISQTGYGSQGHSAMHSSSMTTSKMPSSVSSVKDSLDGTSASHVYDMSHTTAAPRLTSTMTMSASDATSSLGLSTGTLSNSNVTVAKSTISTSKTGVPSLPPGVPTVLGHHPYIMSQGGLPFAAYSLQQPVFTYDDLQLLQQRIPPLANYYDVSFQQSTGRDAGLSNVAYTGAEGKFGRGDNSSPVPTTLAQQQQSSTQQHQQAFISPPALPHGYSYYYPSGVMTGGFTQYGAPIFPMPPASNAHGVNTNTHFQKPNTYSSHGYASGYDSLGQAQDYGKTSYGTSSQNQSKGLGGSSASGGSVSAVGGTDLSASVYSKTHSQMNKQPYDKPGFHAGTPPPFNLAGTPTGPMGAPSTAYAAAPFIPMMAQHHSPMMQHHLHQESGGNSQRPNPNQAQNKANASSKQGYGTSYWPSN